MKKKKEPRQDVLYANEKSKHGDLNTKRIPAAEMDERVALTDVIIHSGQKTVSRYIRPVVMHHVALYPREQKCPANVHAFCLRVTRCVSWHAPPSWNGSRQEFTASENWSLRPFLEIFRFIDTGRDKGYLYNRKFFSFHVKKEMTKESTIYLSLNSAIIYLYNIIF